MKKWILIWVILTCTQPAVAVPYLAEFGGYGEVVITESKYGLRLKIDLRVEKNHKYKLKFLPQCRGASSFISQYRHRFEIITTSGKTDQLVRSAYFPGMHSGDLETRRLNTLALYRLEKNHWKVLECVSLSGMEDESSNSGHDKKP